MFPARPRTFRALLFVAAALAAAAAVGTAAYAFPHGTSNLDEVAYQTQANVLRHGHLDLPAETHVPFFRPFLSGVRDDRVVFKYQPEWPALIAASDALFGSSVPLRALCAALGVLAIAWLAWELTREELVALLAAALALASPFIWVQGASLLGYQLTLVLGAGAAAGLLRAARLRTWTAGIAAGAIVGLAVLHRPFDALLAVVPVLVFVAARYRSELPLGRPGAGLLLGAAPLGAALLAYNAAVMGSPLRLPYGVTGDRDVFFFGWRASFVVPGTGHDGQVHYTVGRAFSTLAHDLALMPRFVAIAPVALLFAAVCAVRRRRDPRCWLLVSMFVLVFAGYFFWWATANAEDFGIDRGLGPFYDYGALAPLCVLAAWGIAGSRPRRQAVAVLAVISVAAAVPASWVVLRAAHRQGAARSALVSATRADSPSATLTLVPPSFPGNPYLDVATDDRLDARHLVGLDVPGRRLELLDRFAHRPSYLVRRYRRFGDPFGRELGDRVPLRRVRGVAVRVGIEGREPARASGTAYLRIGDEPPVLSTARPGAISASWTVTAAMLRPSRATQLAVGVTVAPRGAHPAATMTEQWYECRFDARAVGGAVEVLTPCDGWAHDAFPGGKSALTREDVSGALHVSVRGSP